MNRHGFTLIELSIVLVIIGLIIGGVLVGQDLIGAAAVRATISQVEKFNTAVNTFRNKFGALPGDIPASQVTQFGFSIVPVRAGTVGQGDGNGVIEGYDSGGTYDTGMSGETTWFWADLSANSNLIDGSYTAASTNPSAWNTTFINTNTAAPLSAILPPAKLGNGIYFYAYSYHAVNYFGLSAMAEVDGNGSIRNAIAGMGGITVAAAYNIDKKIDDGLPQTGQVAAFYVDENQSAAAPYWAWGPNSAPAAPAVNTGATAGALNTCFDNNSVGGATQKYSMEINNGNGANCGLSFKMQGAAR